MKAVEPIELMDADGRIDVGHVVLEAALGDLVIPAPLRRVALPRVAGDAVKPPAAKSIASQMMFVCRTAMLVVARRPEIVVLDLR